MTDTFSWHNTFVLYHEKKEIEKQVYGLIKLDMPNKLLLVFIQNTLHILNRFVQYHSNICRTNVQNIAHS